MSSWLAAAVLGFLVFGTYYNHYGLSLLPPLWVNAALCLERRRLRLGNTARGLSVALVVLVGLAEQAVSALQRNVQNRADEREILSLAQAIGPRLQGRCLYVFNGDPILYDMTHSCLPSRFVFPKL